MLDSAPRVTAQRSVAEGSGQQVQAGRGTSGDDDLFLTFGRIRANEFGYLGAGLLKGHSAACGKLMSPAVHAGVNRTIKIRFGINHRIRLLRGGRRIQIHQRMPMNLLIQNRELCPNLLKINHFFPSDVSNSYEI